MSTSQKGFTLFELMIVLLILAAISAAVAITANTTSSPEKRLDSEGRALYAQIQFALDESLIRQQLIGLRIDSDGDIANQYSWHSYSSANTSDSNSIPQWVSLDSDVLTETLLSDGMVINAKIDDALLEELLAESLNDDRESVSAPPSIVLYPSGELSAFTLILSYLDQNISEYTFVIGTDKRGQLTNSIVGEVVDD
ncbi:pilus assembly FimT family protein [Eionea flava]